MAGKVIGISGSPIPRSNTDRAVQAVLDATGLDHEFIKLSQLTIEPCRACLGCKKSNECVVKDDGWELAKKFKEADAFVVGAFTPYSSLDARTKTFMERMYCFRHQTGGNAGKIGASVITTACPDNAEHLPPAAQTATSQLAFWMMEEGMDNLGSMTLLGNVPCIRCGSGDDCAVSGIKMMFGENATVATTPVNQFEDDPELMQQARTLGEAIGKSVTQRITA